MTELKLPLFNASIPNNENTMLTAGTIPRISEAIFLITGYIWKWFCLQDVNFFDEHMYLFDKYTLFDDE